MDIEFDCGATALNVGELGMAIRHHLTECIDDDCRADAEATLKKVA